MSAHTQAPIVRRTPAALHVVEAVERFVLIVAIGLMCLLIAVALFAIVVNYDGSPPKPAVATGSDKP